MADLILPNPMKRVARPGETIIQEFFFPVAPNGSLTVSSTGDAMISIKEVFGVRDGPREEFTEDELSQLPVELREEARKNGFRPDVEFGRVGAGEPLQVHHGDRVRGTIECVVPVSQPSGTVTANVRVDGFASPVEVPFILSVGEVQIELLTHPAIARRGQPVSLPVRVTFPPGMPGATLAFELRGEHTRVDPAQFISVPTGGSVVGNLTLVTDLDAPLGTLPQRAMSVMGFDTHAGKSLIFDITIAEPAKVTAKLLRPSQAEPHARAMRGGKLRCQVQFTADEGLSSTVVFSPALGMPAGVLMEVPTTAAITNGTVVPVTFSVDLQAAPANSVPTGLLWRTVDGTSSGRLDFMVSIDQRVVRTPLPVTVALTEIQCIDEGDGPGTAEPYLWVLFFKIDGETVSMGAGAMLQGQVRIQRVRSPGHGNLGSRDVDAGDTIRIPGDLGTWNTTLVPIPIVDDEARRLVETFAGWENIPGSVGVLVVLMEEDSLPIEAALAGYHSLIRTFEIEMNKLIPTLGFNKQELTQTDEQAVQEAISKAVKKAVVHVLDFPTMVAAWIAGPDDTLGSAAWKADHDKLVRDRVIGLERRWKEGVKVNIHPDPQSQNAALEDGPGRFITSGGEWILKGSIRVN